MPSVLRRAGAATLTALLATSTVAVASPADAATGSFSGGVLAVSMSTPDLVRIHEPYGEPGIYNVSFELGNGPESIPGCTGGTDYFRCAGLTGVVVNGSPGLDYLSITGPIAAEVHGGGGDDTIDVDEAATATVHGDAGKDRITVTMAANATAGATIDGGDGNDGILGTVLADTIHGGSGDDSLDGAEGDDTLTGDAGNDWLQGGAGNDTLSGSDGDDRFAGGDGADAYLGGAGADTADYFDQYMHDTGVIFSATLDDVANDGASGEGDNISADGSVENIDAGDSNFSLVSVTLVGDDGPNRLEGYSPRSMTADGRGGDDVIRVSSIEPSGVPVAEPGVTTVHGGAGNDTIDSGGWSTTVDGGAGHDTIHSGRGDDAVTGGPGRDTIDSWDGDDVVDTRDGEVDQVACYLGTDTLIGDRIDVVDDGESIDPETRCEVQDLAGPVTTGTLTLKLSKRTKVSERGVAKVRVRNGFDAKVRLTIRVKARKPELTAARTTAKVRANATKTVKIRLTKKALRVLERKRKLKVTVALKATKGAEAKVKRKTTLRR